MTDASRNTAPVSPGRWRTTPTRPQPLAPLRCGHDPPVPDRRHRARVPFVLRLRNGDPRRAHHQGRATDRRGVRVHHDVAQPDGARATRPGDRVVRWRAAGPAAHQDLRRVQVDAREARRTRAAARADRARHRRLRHPGDQEREPRGRRRDRHARCARARRRHAGVHRHQRQGLHADRRRSREAVEPALQHARAGDPRGQRGGGEVRRTAAPDRRPVGSDGRHVRQRARRAEDRREDRRRVAPAIRFARRPVGAHRRSEEAGDPPEPARPPRRRAALAPTGDAAHRRAAADGAERRTQAAAATQRARGAVHRTGVRLAAGEPAAGPRRAADG